MPEGDATRHSLRGNLMELIFQMMSEEGMPEEAMVEAILDLAGSQGAHVDSSSLAIIIEHAAAQIDASYVPDRPNTQDSEEEDLRDAQISLFKGLVDKPMSEERRLHLMLGALHGASLHRDADITRHDYLLARWGRLLDKIIEDSYQPGTSSAQQKAAKVLYKACSLYLGPAAAQAPSFEEVAARQAVWAVPDYLDELQISRELNCLSRVSKDERSNRMPTLLGKFLDISLPICTAGQFRTMHQLLLRDLEPIRAEGDYNSSFNFVPEVINFFEALLPENSGHPLPDWLNMAFLEQELNFLHTSLNHLCDWRDTIERTTPGRDWKLRALRLLESRLVEAVAPQAATPLSPYSFMDPDRKGRQDTKAGLRDPNPTTDSSSSSSSASSSSTSASQRPTTGLLGDIRVRILPDVFEGRPELRRIESLSLSGIFRPEDHPVMTVQMTLDGNRFWVPQSALR